MPTLQEILDNKKDFSDDRKITIEGVEVSLGDLRSGYMKQSDYTKKTTEVARQRQELEKAQLDFTLARQEAEAQLEALAGRLLKREPEQKDQLHEMLEENPVGKALMTKIEELNTKISKVDEFMKNAEDRFRNHETVFVANQHRAMLERIKAADPTADPEQIVKFAKDNGLSRLDFAYRLMSEEERFNRALKEKTQEAKDKGIEEGKRVAMQPIVPLRRTVPVSLTEKDPKSMEEAAIAAAGDPEILAIINGQGTL